VNSVINIFFSPTGTTKKVGEKISSSFKDNSVKQINLTSINEQEINLSSTDIAIIGMPVHRGCLPEIAIKQFKRIMGDKTPCILYVIYGNRDYGSALLKLKQLVSSQGLIPIAEGTFIGDHS